MPRPKHLLFIDAYDSFSESIAALLQQLLTVKISTIRVDSWTISANTIYLAPCGGEPTPNVGSGHQPRGFPVKVFDLRTTDYDLLLQYYDAVVVGPGPGDPRNPADLGIISLLWNAAERCGIPVLGICLGFQSLCLAYGASIAPLSDPCHGHAQKILHCNEDIFAHVGPVVATNYHSLEIQVGSSNVNSLASWPSSTRSSLSNDSSDSEARNWLKIQQLAWNEQGTLMAVRHLNLPFWGLQFHPESCRSNAACHDLVRNWWNAAMQGPSRTRHSHDLEITPSHGHASKEDLPLAGIFASSRHTGDEQALRDKLHHLTHSAGDVVQTHTLQQPIHTRDVAELCQCISPSHAVAMLESTKKGRFCIYAIPSPGTFSVEYFEQKAPTESDHSASTKHSSFYVIDSAQLRSTSFKSTCPDVFQELQGLMLTRMAKGGHPDSPFWGGFMGYLSYKMGLETLNLATRKVPNGGPNADVNLLWVERSIVIDKLMDTVHVQSIRRGDAEWISTMTETLRSFKSKIRYESDLGKSQLSLTLASARITLPDERAYKKNIHACQSYLNAGSSYELCLTTEAQITLASSHANTPWLLYHNLQNHNPAPFAAYLGLGETKILSSSPEQFLAWDRTGSIDMVPMKGTVSKSDPNMTLAKATAILNSPKESAENLMIADLIRHDLYSTVGCSDGAFVEVVKLCHVVEHETVFQLVSHIRAQAPILASASEDDKQRQVIQYGHKALRQCIPPGSMTGAPKKRSCEILCELEQRPRGVYSGVLGYLDVGGGGAFNVCIRTAFSHTDEDKDGRQTWRVGAGGAITVLSDVDAEWEEMRTKLESVLSSFRVNGASR